MVNSTKVSKRKLIAWRLFYSLVNVFVFTYQAHFYSILLDVLPNLIWGSLGIVLFSTVFIAIIAYDRGVSGFRIFDICIIPILFFQLSYLAWFLIQVQHQEYSP